MEEGKDGCMSNMYMHKKTNIRATLTVLSLSMPTRQLNMPSVYRWTATFNAPSDGFNGPSKNGPEKWCSWWCLVDWYWRGWAATAAAGAATAAAAAMPILCFDNSDSVNVDTSVKQWREIERWKETKNKLIRCRYKHTKCHHSIHFEWINVANCH